MSAHFYDLQTTWRLQGADAGEVWDVLEDAARWPEWWKGVRSVTELDGGGAGGIGQVARFEWRAALPYSVVFAIRATRRERPGLLEGEASGDLDGLGRFVIREAAGLTTVTYTWKVETARPWMRRTAPLLRPAFVWGHDRIMRAGGEGLARRTGATFIS